MGRGESGAENAGHKLFRRKYLENRTALKFYINYHSCKTPSIFDDATDLSYSTTCPKVGLAWPPLYKKSIFLKNYYKCAKPVGKFVMYTAFFQNFQLDYRL